MNININLPTIICGLVIFGVCFAIVRSWLKKGKISDCSGCNGCSGCGHSCSHDEKE